MDRDEIIGILASILEKEPAVIAGLSDNAPLTDLGFDSLKYIEFVVAVEEKYGIEILDSDLLSEKFETPAALFQTLGKYFETSVYVYKCVVCDCDGVLWKGVAGESGSDAAYADDDTRAFMQTLAELKSKGVYICLCSKNSEAAITEMFVSIVDLPLRYDDISIIKSGTTNKAATINEIAAELGISTDSVIFVDDSEYELGLVSSLLPDVTTVKSYYTDKASIQYIADLFTDLPQQSLDRTKLYREQKEREKVRVSAATEDEYNEKLGTEVVCRAISAADALNSDETERIAELSQRTNRFNLSGKRYLPEEITAIHTNPEYRIYTLSASDIYGDMGVVAAAVVCGSIIENFMLSCRVLGRGFETVLIEKIKADAKSVLSGIYVETDKNIARWDFYTQHGVTTI